VNRTLDSEHERERFARRLEAFSDIVFGFALAQTAFGLDVPKTVHELKARLVYLAFFLITFALIAVFWTMHYRLFRWLFVAQRVDVVLNFALLATVALLPYALQVFRRFSESAIGEGAYAIELGIAFGLLAVLEGRGLRQRGGTLAPDVLAAVRRATYVHAASALVFLASVPLLAAFGGRGAFVWVLVPVTAALTRRVLRARPSLASASTR